MAGRRRGPRPAPGTTTRSARVVVAAAVVLLLGPLLAGCAPGEDGSEPGPGSASAGTSAGTPAADPATSSDTLPDWEPLGTLEVPRDDFGTAVIGDRIWVMGGMTGERGNRLTSVEVLDTTTGRWTTSGIEMQKGLASFETVAIGRRIYLFGGFDAASVATDYAGVLDTRTGRWTRLPVVPHERYAHTVTLHRGRIYLVGGRDADGPVAEIDVFDPRTRRWSTSRVEMPDARDSHDTVSTAAGLMVVGGFDAQGPTDRIDLFDPVTGEASDFPALPRPISRGGATLADGRLWVSWHQFSYVIDLAGGEWQEANPLTRSRHGLGYVHVGDHIYAIAGCSEAPLRDVRTVDRLPLA